ncbi:MAG: hypothetical protein A2882_05215 [Phenylobacterium sp. RIFCSPHIGHO2_01_FULL_70_10]|nr:MAG: hypothetical protein A2882_05215 [Phenylobacterium sp. RIFCSPHIGHO2_01_FULL_70_10]
MSEDRANASTAPAPAAGRQHTPNDKAPDDGRNFGPLGGFEASDGHGDTNAGVSPADETEPVSQKARN